MIDADGPTGAAKREVAMAPPLMTGQLNVHVGHAGLADKGYAMHSFRVGSAVSQALQGRSIVQITVCSSVFLGSRNAWHVDTQEYVLDQRARPALESANISQ